jgi:Adenylate and Guanylate cyclase catalytic domain
MGDFEDLFDLPDYKDIEKIKTIGSCLMAASGLNAETRSKNRDPLAHLYALMDFSCALLTKLEQFNRDMLNFKFEMEIGFNYGEVTAGVVGTTKLLYDIWGDAVNVASRMYSTGVHGRIQVWSYVLHSSMTKFGILGEFTLWTKYKLLIGLLCLVDALPKTGHGFEKLTLMSETSPYDDMDETICQDFRSLNRLVDRDSEGFKPILLSHVLCTSLYFCVNTLTCMAKHFS